MKTVNTPGFTAEATLSRGSSHYNQAAAQIAAYGAALQPANYVVNKPPLCLKRLCFIGIFGQISCNYYLGMWNPATHRCE
jgi:hypothetical protein